MKGVKGLGECRHHMASKIKGWQATATKLAWQRTLAMNLYRYSVYIMYI